MAKTVAQVGRKGAPKNEGGEEAKEDSTTAALAETPEEVEGTKDTTAAFIFGGIVKGEEEEETEDTIVEGVAVGASATNHPVDINLKSMIQTLLEWTLGGVKQPRRATSQLIKGVVDFHDLCKMLEFDFELSSIAILRSRRIGMIIMLPSQ
jgi:hypothetical protein